MYWQASAPSNIALIKYMGKQDSAKNQACNPSLSYTLPHLTTTVRLEKIEADKDDWQPLLGHQYYAIDLSQQAQTRFLNHLGFLKKEFGFKGHFRVYSANNFSMSAGLASSASSFAALTQAACSALSDLTQKPQLGAYQQAMLSRQGSGSSCRSFFSPFVLWEEDQIETVQFPWSMLQHDVLLVDGDHKSVSSSQAHQRVKTSPLFKDRSQRAKNNLIELMQALKKQAWPKAFEICWREFIDMHQLFQSAEPAFDYFTDKSKRALTLLENFWQTHKDGPIVTMDAGPNIHLLYRPDQVTIRKKIQKQFLNQLESHGTV